MYWLAEMSYDSFAVPSSSLNGVGTDAPCSFGRTGGRPSARTVLMVYDVLRSFFSQVAKKCSLSLTIGPPSVAPYCSRRYGCFAVSVSFSDSVWVFRLLSRKKP